MDRLSLLNPEHLGTLVAQEAQGEVDALDLAGSGNDPMGILVIPSACDASGGRVSKFLQVSVLSKRCPWLFVPRCEWMPAFTDI